MRDSALKLWAISPEPNHVHPPISQTRTPPPPPRGKLRMRSRRAEALGCHALSGGAYLEFGWRESLVKVLVSWRVHVSTSQLAVLQRMHIHARESRSWSATPRA